MIHHPNSMSSIPPRLVADVHAPNLSFPREKRPLGGRNVYGVAAAEDAPPTRFRWDSNLTIDCPMTLRIVCAVDGRVPYHVRVEDAETGDRVGNIDVLYPSSGQMFELPLTKSQTRAALNHGLDLSLEKGAPLWIAAPGPNAPDAVLPHLFPDTSPSSPAPFLSLFCSAASLQPCDWMEVCVLDGLRDWAGLGRNDARDALHQHLDTFFDPKRGQREDIRGRPCDDHAGGPESTGPFAILALEFPSHPALRFADEGFALYHHSDLDLIGSDKIVTESCYNIAYPMMAIALQREDADLRRRALRQLDLSRKYLAEPDDLHLRHFFDDGRKAFTNWSRGVAWYLLGWVRTLALLPKEERPADLVAEADRVAAWVGRHQQPDGLWPCFLKENEVRPDTSGCAGIAAAVALGVREGMIDSDHLSVARLACDALWNHTTIDGWLRGASQSNKKETHHMDIQRDPFRVVAPWGMGMFAQLLAALEPEKGASS